MVQLICGILYVARAITNRQLPLTLTDKRILEMEKSSHWFLECPANILLHK